MTNDEIKATILANILFDVEHYSTDMFWYLANGAHSNRSGRLLVQKAIDARQDGVVLYKPSDWLGRPLTNSERTKFCRALPQLGKEGLIICYVDSRGRTTHVALTEKGTEVALGLVATAS